MSQVKELNYFVEEQNWSRGVNWYRQQFRVAPENPVAVGEASTAYTKFPRYTGVPERMAATVPDGRFIYVVRHPIERVRSHYQHRVATGEETSPAASAVFDNPIYLDYSRYSMQMERYERHFPLERMLVVTSEDLRSRRQETIQRVYAFLGVDNAFVPPALEKEFHRSAERRTSPRAIWAARRLIARHFPQAKFPNDGVAPAHLHIWGRQSVKAPTDATPGGFPEALQSKLAELLREDVTRLRRYMGQDFDGWGIA